jgi:hypothetical protein
MDTLVRLPGPQIQFLDSYCDVLPWCPCWSDDFFGLQVEQTTSKCWWISSDTSRRLSWNWIKGTLFLLRISERLLFSEVPSSHFVFGNVWLHMDFFYIKVLGKTTKITMSSAKLWNRYVKSSLQVK